MSKHTWMIQDGLGDDKTICTANGNTVATELNAVDAMYIIDAHNATLEPDEPDVQRAILETLRDIHLALLTPIDGAQPTEKRVCPNCGEPADDYTAKELFDAVGKQAPDKRSILDEEWELKPNYHHKNGVIYGNGVSITIEKWNPQVAALPDCLRALVKASGVLASFKYMRGSWTDAEDHINAALKKAGIEG